jgi:hypothetical protein
MKTSNYEIKNQQPKVRLVHHSGGGAIYPTTAPKEKRLKNHESGEQINLIAKNEYSDTNYKRMKGYKTKRL